MVLKGLREIEPYVAGSQPQGKDIIKLNTNENAYGPSPAVKEALAGFETESLRKYSSLDQASLRQALAEQLGVSADQIIVGNGSDDILSMAFTRSGLICTTSTIMRFLSTSILKSKQLIILLIMGGSS